MIRQYIKQAFQTLKETPLISTVSIAGTALSIAMIMIVVLIYQIQLAGFSPETHRNRMLYVNGVRANSLKPGMSFGGGLSAEAVKECFYSLKTPETVTAYLSESRSVSLPGKRIYTEYTIKYTDTSFWTVFDFHFVAGQAFSEADFQSGVRSVVVNEKLARALFNKTDAVGEVIVINFIQYRISGVVQEVSISAMDAFADVWIPYTAVDNLVRPPKIQAEGMFGNFNVCILANNKSDFASIRAELEESVKRYNQTKENYELQLLNSPLTRTDIAMGSTPWKKTSPWEFAAETGALILFLLLVPALNLTGVNQSSVERRKTEIGVRKSFGATYSILIRQILYENFVTTFIGGVIGFALSFVLLAACKSFLLENNPTLNAEMLFQPLTFVVAFVFILVINLLSAVIPASRIAGSPIVDALKEIE